MASKKSMMWWIWVKKKNFDRRGGRTHDLLRRQEAMQRHENVKETRSSEDVSFDWLRVNDVTLTTTTPANRVLMNERVCNHFSLFFSSLWAASPGLQQSNWSFLLG